MRTKVVIAARNPVEEFDWALFANFDDFARNFSFFVGRNTLTQPADFFL
jgi:hypothetical protein